MSDLRSPDRIGVPLGDADEEHAKHLEQEVVRLRLERDHAKWHVRTLLDGQALELDSLQQRLASAQSSRTMQTKCTLAFREDWLREKERADRLEVELNSLREKVRGNGRLDLL